MNKIAFFIVIAFCALFPTFAAAQQSPFRSCRMAPISGATLPSQLLCTVVENDTIITDVVVNRGNCTSPRTLRNQHNPNLPLQNFGLDKPFNFGQEARVPLTDLKCVGHVIEVTILTNKGNWTFSFQ